MGNGFFFVDNVDRCRFCQPHIERLSTRVNKLKSEVTIVSAMIKVVIVGLGIYSMIVKHRAMCSWSIDIEMTYRTTD